MGNHEKCIQHSAVCVDGRDPLLHLLPHKRNLPLLPDSVKKTILESVWSLFQSDKLNRLVLDGTLRTTLRVEATHRVICNPAPKGKPMRRNQTAVLQFGATIAAMKGRCRGKFLRTLVDRIFPSYFLVPISKMPFVCRSDFKFTAFFDSLQ